MRVRVPISLSAAVLLESQRQASCLRSVGRESQTQTDVSERVRAVSSSDNHSGAA